MVNKKKERQEAKRKRALRIRRFGENQFQDEKPQVLRLAKKTNSR